MPKKKLLTAVRMRRVALCSAVCAQAALFVLERVLHFTSNANPVIKL